MRPIIRVDGTFLKGRYPGVVLTAITIEGNNHVYPITFALVCKENNEYWEWFLKKLKDHVVGHDHQFVLLSDRHKSIIQAVPKILPNACHMYCAQHMSLKYGNAKVRWLLKEAANTLNQNEFWGFMLQIWAISEKAYNSLMQIGPLNKWASAFQEKSRFGIIYTNHVESWNRMIIPERQMPVTSLLEGIHANIIRHHRDYRVDGEKFKTPVTKWWHELILHNAWRGRTFTREKFSPTLWTVYGENKTCMVDLNTRSCTCKWWEAMGIPCEHAMSVIRETKSDPYAFCVVYYKRETYAETYKEQWRPTRGKDEWPQDRASRRILPPLPFKQAGRPKKKRKKGKLEGVPVQLRRCSRCKAPGHNKETASNSKS
ncbi:hypothetical protein AQUCO_04000079v1 [Aquilegia coerulea]|uniref:SWIM-type domain-containing protein n=1 Tax=Aquilegia coerulea TaxID=218851 RepID=A0A2G5CRA5_AQUCA|nr:hypothetical protein AQUCO_04000079v1 [Aquilegia coerulea]